MFSYRFHNILSRITTVARYIGITQLTFQKPLCTFTCFSGNKFSSKSLAILSIFSIMTLENSVCIICNHNSKNISTMNLGILVLFGQVLVFPFIHIPMFQGHEFGQIFNGHMLLFKYFQGK